MKRLMTRRRLLDVGRPTGIRPAGSLGMAVLLCVFTWAGSSTARGDQQFAIQRQLFNMSLEQLMQIRIILESRSNLGCAPTAGVPAEGYAGADVPGRDANRAGPVRRAMVASGRQADLEPELSGSLNDACERTLDVTVGGMPSGEDSGSRQGASNED